MGTTTFIDMTAYIADLNSPCDNEDLFQFGAIFTAILNSFIFFFSLLGNSLVLWIVVKYENLSSITNIFIVNLSITDLVFASMLPFWAAYHMLGWVFGEPLCKFMSAVFSVGFYSSIIFLTMMTIYRYLAVVHPLSALRTRRRVSGIILSGIIWVISCLATIPVLIFTTLDSDHDGFLMCEYDNSNWEVASTYQQNLFFLVSLAIISFCYFNILRTLLRSPSQRRYRTVKLILIIIVVYFLSWAPYNILMFLGTIDLQGSDCEMSRHLAYAMYICEKVAFSHCCLNPVLYAFVGIKFNRHLKRMFLRCRPCIVQELSISMRVSSHDNLHHEDLSLY
ncbi:chemokine XC receptor 1 [Lissotriton helveticus]